MKSNDPTREFDAALAALRRFEQEWDRRFRQAEFHPMPREERNEWFVKARACQENLEAAYNAVEAAGAPPRQKMELAGIVTNTLMHWNDKFRPYVSEQFAFDDERDKIERLWREHERLWKACTATVDWYKRRQQEGAGDGELESIATELHDLQLKWGEVSKRAKASVRLLERTLHRQG
jgi:hypothetical protein